MPRISPEILQEQVDKINQLLSTPTIKWAANNEFNIGHHHLNSANGGYGLYQITNAQGGDQDILGVGHVDKSSLHRLLNVFIKGIKAVEYNTFKN